MRWSCACVALADGRRSRRQEERKSSSFDDALVVLFSSAFRPCPCTGNICFLFHSRTGTCTRDSLLLFLGSTCTECLSIRSEELTLSPAVDLARKAYSTHPSISLEEFVTHSFVLFLRDLLTPLKFCLALVTAT